MRCPKCGFISFDHLTSCAKCGKDIADVASDLQGTSINVETPMFLSGALASYAERQEAFGDQGGFDVEEGIDFSMEDESIDEEAVEVEEEIDIAFDESPEEEAGISMSMEEAGETAAAEKADVDFTIEPEATEVEVETEVSAEVKIEAEPEKDESLEELDFMDAVDSDEGGLEFDLDDFIEDIDEDKLSESDDTDDIDIDLDEEKD